MTGSRPASPLLCFSLPSPSIPTRPRLPLPTPTASCSRVLPLVSPGDLQDSGVTFIHCTSPSLEEEAPRSSGAFGWGGGGAVVWERRRRRVAAAGLPLEVGVGWRLEVRTRGLVVGGGQGSAREVAAGNIPACENESQGLQIPDKHSKESLGGGRDLLEPGPGTCGSDLEWKRQGDSSPLASPPPPHPA